MDSENVTNSTEFIIPDISIYPNPTSGAIHVSGDMHDIASFIVTNHTGEVLRKDIFRDNILLPYSSGIYYLTLVSKTGLYYTEKIMVR